MLLSLLYIPGFVAPIFYPYISICFFYPFMLFLQRHFQYTLLLFFFLCWCVEFYVLFISIKTINSKS
uniref:Uncharacterized protein n=1 Tax=Rhizophora mucronata TaxID=61149 RepID=A0A2P2NW18_RHIMU